MRPEFLPDRIELETAGEPTHALIWLHGLGADGSDFVPVIDELGLPAGTALRCIFPHAPLRPVSCNGGYVMRAWYDILSLSPQERRIDNAGLLESCATVEALIAREAERGIPAARIVLAGFSQGGAVAYTAALRRPEAVAGVVALSTYIPSPGLLTCLAQHAALPVFAAHGDEDEVVSPALGRAARDCLEAGGLRPAWHTYPMGHQVCLPELRDLGNWLTALLRG
ncbi:carboxylesterase [Pseudothauera nasutitermitis]|uniref:Carboxylesterase n=1 Tax=Pseudothauera nasutitermitis TaxID=2565930 RepID=A0A4S4B044_9RHOO|nr:dienelactone hydrolase family protein [Pseudothauera nasutitermitis]THF65833.1 carboxylesterase [Pseudothauera nasutitermitis]